MNIKIYRRRYMAYEVDKYQLTLPSILVSFTKTPFMESS